MHMKENDLQSAINPLLQIDNKVEQQGLVMLNNITGIPIVGEPFLSSHLIVSLCVRGYVEAEYDLKPVVYYANDFCIMHSGHVVRTIRFSDDYLVRMIVVSDDFIEKYRLRNVEHFNAHSRYYMANPVFRLSDEQARQMNQAFDLLDSVSRIEGLCHEEMLLHVFHTILMMRYDYSPIPDDVLANDKFSLSTRFLEAVARHYQDSHNVDFYAQMFNLSPKYFSSIIKSETGIGAGEYIDRYLTLQAKTLLTARQHLTIQQIGYMLGFSEQTSFSRFFKQRTGMPPSEYRERKDVP